MMIVAIACGVLAMWLWPTARPRRRWPRRLISLGLWLLAALGVLLAIGVSRYQPFRAGTLIAEVAVHQLSASAHEVTVSLPGAVPQTYLLHGDQWQFDVRLLRWRVTAAVLGAPRLYLPDRLSGRYLDIEQERRAPRSAHALSTPAQWDAWQLTRRWAQWLPLFEADFGSSAYLPLVDGARFQLLVGDVGGIVARPADAETARRLRDQSW